MNDSNINDFSKGAVWRRILYQAVPLTIAQLVQLLYNVVDRIYIGHMGDDGGLALTGIGLSFPVVTLIMAFSALFGIGGVPLFSMERGARNEEKAGKILGNSFCLLLISSSVLTVLGYIFLKPLLYLFGASGESVLYAGEYLRIYLAGTVFSSLATGLNGYISAQGFPKIGMMSVIIGAVINIVLDPLFIFAFGMGISGAALATVISQAASAIWVVGFLKSRKSVIPLTLKNIRLQPRIVGSISKLGVSNFIMQGTNFVVQVVCNSTLQSYGGDIYVGIMTVANSIREIFMLPLSGVMSGSQPVISFNYGAKLYDRVKSGIKFNSVAGAVYTAIVWLLVLIFPKFWIGVFSDDVELINIGTKALTVYFFGFVFMALQFAGQSTFQAVGDAKHAIFFSLLRKVIIVVPLTVILPIAGFGVMGVFLAEPVSNIIGGTASYLAMRYTVYKKL